MGVLFVPKWVSFLFIKVGVLFILKVGVLFVFSHADVFKIGIRLLPAVLAPVLSWVVA